LVLTDGTITLRHPTEADIDAIHEACQDPEVAKWTGVPSPYFKEHARQWIERSRLERLEGRSQAFLAFLADGTLAASCSLMELDKQPHYGEIGYWVAEPARRRGVATRAVELLKRFGTEELGLTLIELVIHKDNAPSRRTAERAGFRVTDELRPAPRTETPGPLDHVVYVWSRE
jgi:RimJ/RimL family protein N-acetyltransferase